MQNTHEEDLRSKCIVSYCCDAIFNVIKEDFPLAFIINCYFHMHKNVKSNYTKHLKDKTLKNTMMADIKKLQRIACIKDIEKGYEFMKDKNLEELEYFN